MAWWNDNPVTRTVSRSVDSIAEDPLAAATMLINPVQGAKLVMASTTKEGQDLARDVPIVGSATGLESSADIAANEQQVALGQALAHQEKMYGVAQGHLDPYAETGGKYLASLSSGIRSGAFSPDEMEYSGATPDFNYSGGPQGFEYNAQGPEFVYNKQQPQFNYDRGPLAGYKSDVGTGSIQSYMGDIAKDPGYQFQLQQGQQAIDRASAASGRFGGGRAAQELLRQGQGLAATAYGDAFNRAAAEQGVASGINREQYGRDVNFQDRLRQQEQEQYGRGRAGFDIARQQEQEQYGRNVSDFDRATRGEETRYNRSLGQYGLQSGLEQEQYNRRLGEYGFDVGKEQEMYGRARADYSMDAERRQNRLNQYMGMAGMGQQASQALANAATGHGSNLADISIQQGNTAAAATMANSNQLAKLMQMGGAGASMYAGM